MKMKIAMFSKELPTEHPNGVSIQADRIAAALARCGHEVTMVSFDEASNNALYRHVQLGRKGTGKASALFDPAFAFRQYAKTSDADILHFHGDDYLVGKTAGKKIRTFHGSAFHEALHSKNPVRFFRQALFYLFEIISAFKADRCVSVSPTKILPKIAAVIPCAIPLDRCKSAMTKSSHPSILFIGDLDSRKRGRFMLRIFAKKILPAIPDCTLTVIGPQKAGGRNVMWLNRPSEDELNDEFAKAWVYCSASSYEGFGVPIIEAMVSGTPVVSSRNAGATGIISDSVNGLISRDDKIADSLLSILTNKDLAAKLSAAALTDVVQYDSIRIAKLYESEYVKAMEC